MYIVIYFCGVTWLDQNLLPKSTESASSASARNQSQELRFEGRRDGEIVISETSSPWYKSITTNIAPENSPFQKERLVSQPPFFQGRSVSTC